MLCKNNFTKFILLPAIMLVLLFSYSEARPKKKKRKAKNKVVLTYIPAKKIDADSLLQTFSNESNSKVIGDEGEDLEELISENGILDDPYKIETIWEAMLDDGEVSEYTDNGISKHEFLEDISDWIGTPYRFGGTTRQGIDCSAFMREIYRDALKIELPRTANEQFAFGKVIKEDDLKFGDMIFFKTKGYAPITHVGVYLGNDQFAHASSRGGVMISDLSSPYYTRTFKGGKRLTNSDINKLEIETDMRASSSSVIEESQTGTK